MRFSDGKIDVAVMTIGIRFSDEFAPLDWSEAATQANEFGPKGAMLSTLPRAWTPAFALVPASSLSAITSGNSPLEASTVSKIRQLADSTGEIIVRSSVIGESIWDRGSYKSIVISSEPEGFDRRLVVAMKEVAESAPKKRMGLVLQCYVRPRSRGELGNLLRISKTRDHWELSTEGDDNTTSRLRFNTQRDEAADSESALTVRRGLPRERLFGSVGAWLNNQLLRGRPQRLNCEWLTDNKRIYLVQIDDEDEDFSGINPFQIRIAPAHRSLASRGKFFASADEESMNTWDKLKVLEELWEPTATHKPMLFFSPLFEIDGDKTPNKRQLLEDDFRSLIGPDNIVVRTSVRAGTEKLPNLPRTECVSPEMAAAWCLEKCDEFRNAGYPLRDLAFVAHRFIAARSSAWARAAPGSPTVEIHTLWGLPDALQYCPYDIWEVHVPTEVATEYPEYKSNILIPQSNGGWEYVRVKNELARNLATSRSEAIDIASRSSAIANRIGRACHIMWFVGCVDDGGRLFNIPWYWTEAHAAERNVDRSSYRVVTITDRKSLASFEAQSGSRSRQAIQLAPTDLNLMRDTNFIVSVAKAANSTSVPVILAGSTLAHAYYQLRREGCTVLTPSEKEHSRIRRNVNFGKLVRDKIPWKIAERQEVEVTRKMPPALAKGFLTSKLIEEALEAREAVGKEAKTIELADLFEVIRALASTEGITIQSVVSAADEKRRKAGGFDEGLVLLQTAISGQRSAPIDVDRLVTQVLARRIPGGAYEIPFSFFGFMEIDQTRSLLFEDLGVRLDVTLRIDRIELHLVKEAEQFELPLDLTVGSDSDGQKLRQTSKAKKPK